MPSRRSREQLLSYEDVVRLVKSTSWQHLSPYQKSHVLRVLRAHKKTHREFMRDVNS